jgi:hypothetical protein
LDIPPLFLMRSANLHLFYQRRTCFSTHRHSLFRATRIAGGIRFTNKKSPVRPAISCL